MSDFMDYASTSFSEHLIKAPPDADELMSSTSPKNGKNLHQFLDRRAKPTSAPSADFRTVNGWATDLIRLVAKFGGVTVTTQHQAGWSDCVAWIGYGSSWATALGCGENVFALGMGSGAIRLFNDSTCQEIAVFDHQERVKFLKFDSTGRFIASAGPRKLKLWSQTGTQIWCKTIIEPCVTLSFTQDDQELIVATSGNYALRFLVLMAASISPDGSMIALVYRGRPIHIWYLEDGKGLFGLCGAVGKSGPSMSPETALFNPNPSLNILADAYQDGGLALYDTLTQKELASAAGHSFILASTPDGRTLATSDSNGIVHLYDFETLTLLYRMASFDEGVVSLTFSADGLRLLDIRESIAKAWEPYILVRKDSEEDSSFGGGGNHGPSCNFETGL
ncbi:hypothetical protein AJ80_01950 [Polytolypa hystricis UAMH7299]|uniref:Anaphase-promoting complex subunit 4 WD40 domain-containing protein n=1 Tax=Polytolypa hystricis (strain UAMH7299) TaxID=1447883 RepID=A0A2B7YZH4_POLH7|nr:hypothetical protein AJ80_01950 [Polytolypa hystricis UAMH7299]